MASTVNSNKWVKFSYMEQETSQSTYSIKNVGCVTTNCNWIFVHKFNENEGTYIVLILLA